ncbi:MAG TPA: hypothetical protein VM513_29490, partial [Kofleriaceae bacterium]|nr:hypothetical protein [Kofleriaceae bacterium]
MGFFDQVNNLREKASRLGISEDVDRKRDRNDEARGRLDAGRQTLTAILEGNPDAIRTRVSQAAGRGEAVGKLTQVMAQVAPALQQHRGAVQNVVQQLDAASHELGNHAADISNAAGRVENAMGNLLERANLPANVIPRNILSDLVGDAAHDATPRTDPNATDVASTTPPPAAAQAPAAAPPARRRKKKDRELDAVQRPTGTGRPSPREVARGAGGLLGALRSPGDIAGLMRNPGAAVENVVGAATQNLTNAATSAAESVMPGSSSLATGGGLDAVLGGSPAATLLGGGGAGGGVDAALGAIGGGGGGGGGGALGGLGPLGGLLGRATGSNGGGLDAVLGGAGGANPVSAVLGGNGGG